MRTRTSQPDPSPSQELIARPGDPSYGTVAKLLQDLIRSTPPITDDLALRFNEPYHANLETLGSTNSTAYSISDFARWAERQGTAGLRVYGSAVASAEYATVQDSLVRLPGRRRSKVVRMDHDWCARFGAVLSAAYAQPSSHVLALTAPIQFFGQNSKELLEVEILSGHILRIGDDYSLAPASYAKLRALMHEAMARFSPPPNASARAKPAR